MRSRAYLPNSRVCSPRPEASPVMVARKRAHVLGIAVQRCQRLPLAGWEVDSPPRSRARLRSLLRSRCRRVRQR
jgi:hypothetical protein